MKRRTEEIPTVDICEFDADRVNLGPSGIGRPKLEWMPSRTMIAIFAGVLVVAVACMGIAWHASHRAASSETSGGQSDVSAAEDNAAEERRLALVRERARAESLIVEIEDSPLSGRVDCATLRELLRGTDPTALAAATDELQGDFAKMVTMEIDHVGRLVSKACENADKTSRSDDDGSAELDDLRERWCTVRIDGDNFEDAKAAVQRMTMIVDEITARVSRKTEHQQEETTNDRAETNTEPSGEAQSELQLVVPQQPAMPAPTVPQRPSWSVPDTDVSQLPQQDGSL